MLLTSAGIRNEVRRSALAEGGNHYHLANSIITNGLAAEMAAVVESKVYVGVSAGSMIFSRNLSEKDRQGVRRA